MSLKANPTVIGLFMIGAIIIIVGGTAMLAGNTWFKNRTTFSSYFPESVNGLVDGAPVKFQGAPIGKVTKIRIQIDERDRSFKVPVEYEIDVTKLRTQLGTYVDLEQPSVLQRQIEAGLRAQLQMESLVTGQLYIELSYRKNPKEPLLEKDSTEYPEIPTTPSLMAALGTGAGSVVSDVVEMLHKANATLAAIDMPGINKAVLGTAQSMQRLADAPEIRAAFKEIPGMITTLNRTMVRIDTLAATAGAAIQPMSVELKGATKEVNLTLQSLRKTIDETQGLFSTDAGLGFGLEAALKNLKDATNALAVLMRTLEQNPDMLLRGKRPPEEK